MPEANAPSPAPTPPPSSGGFPDDVLERLNEALVAGPSQIIEMVVRDEPLGLVLEALLQFIESQAPDMLCSVLLLDPDGIHVRHGAAPSLPEAFTAAIDGHAVGARAGSCGTAVFRREQVIVEDIATDPLWTDYRAVALAHHLRACWSTPIFDGRRRVLGTFAIYYRRPGRPTTRHQRLIEIATHIAAVAIGHEQKKAAIRAGEERYRATLDHILEGCQLLGFDWRYLYLNPAAARHNRRPNHELLGRKMTEVWPGIEGTPVFALLRRCMEERIALHEEIEFVFPDRRSGMVRRALPAGARRDLCPVDRRHGAPAIGRSGPAGAEDGGDRHPGGRNRPRFQQRPVRHHRPRRIGPDRGSGPRPRPRAAGRGPGRFPPGDPVGAAAPDVQPAAGSRRRQPIELRSAVEEALKLLRATIPATVEFG